MRPFGSYIPDELPCNKTLKTKGIYCMYVNCSVCFPRLLHYCIVHVFKLSVNGCVLAGSGSSLSSLCCSRVWWWSLPCLQCSTSAARSKTPTGWAPNSTDFQVTSFESNQWLQQTWTQEHNHCHAYVVLQDDFRAVNHMFSTQPVCDRLQLLTKRGGHWKA